MTRSPLRFSKKDRSSVSSYQRSLQTSQRQRRREGERGSGSPCFPRQGSAPRRGTAAAPPQERCVRDKAALHRNADAPHPSGTGEGSRQSGRGRCVAVAGQGPRSTPGPQSPGALSPQPGQAGERRRRGPRWGSRSPTPRLRSRPGRAGSCPGRDRPRSTASHRTAAPHSPHGAYLARPGPARRDARHLRPP